MSSESREIHSHTFPPTKKEQTISLSAQFLKCHNKYKSFTVGRYQFIIYYNEKKILETKWCCSKTFIQLMGLVMIIA